MKKAYLALFAALAVTTAIAAPVMAQPYGQPPSPGYHEPGRDLPGGPGRDQAGGPERDHAGGWDIDRRIDWTQERINRGRADGSLDRHEFRRAQSQLNRIRQDERRARWHEGGRLDDQARDMLLARLDHLHEEIHWMRDNGEHRPW